MVKIINFRKKSEYQIQKLPALYNGQFTGIEELKEALNRSFSEKITNVGYIQPGHGSKGRQMWLNTDQDVSDMYVECNGRKEIMLWYYKNECSVELTQPPQKKSKSAPTISKSEQVAQKICEVDDIVSELSEKYGQTYSPEQVRAPYSYEKASVI